MITINGKPAMVTPADDVPGPGQGHWTYNHYAALDDGQRYEIVDGVLFMTPSPSPWHQAIATLFATYLTIHVQFTGLGRVYAAPLDVELSPVDVFQPDVLVVLNAGREKITESHIIGAPDLVVEVASPSTEKQDRFKKLRAYARAGVREYWLANPTTRKVEVLMLEGGAYQSMGFFQGEDRLPSRVVPHFPVQVKQLFS